jgi:hypothetical protein
VSVRVALRGVVAACGVAALAAAMAAAGDRDKTRAPNNAFAASAVSACLRATNPARVRALALDAGRLPFDVAAGHEPGTRPRCGRGELRLLRLEALDVGGERTYVRRGGCRLPCVVPQPTVHVPARAFARPLDLLPGSARNGNGAPLEPCDEQVRNAPQRVGRTLRRMYYKTPAELRRRRNAGRSGGDGPRWSNYGDPGARYRAGRRGAAHYNYVLWNLPRTATGLLPGGGLVRAIVRAGQPLALCRGERIELPAFDVRGRPNGSVLFGYARVRSGAPAARALHGWVLLGYRYERGPLVATTIAL